MKSQSYVRTYSESELRELDDAVEVLEIFQRTSHAHRRVLKSYRLLQEDTKTLEMSRRHWIHEISELNRKLEPLRDEVANSRKMGGELKELLRSQRFDVRHMKEINREIVETLAHFNRDHQEEVATLRALVARASQAMGSKKLSALE